jgi:hypothetical protein
MYDFLSRAAIYFVTFLALILIRRLWHDETWRNPQIQRMPFIKALAIYALISVVPFLRFFIALLYVYTLFVPVKGSKKYDEWQENVTKAKAESGAK